MRRFLKHLFGVFFLLCCLLILGIKTQAAENIDAYISVERFSIGQGYIVTPTKVTVEKGTRVSDIVEQVLGREGYELNIDIHSSYGWYLAGICKADNGKSQIPVSVMKLDTFGYGLQYPTGRLPHSENALYPDLEEFSYQLDDMSSGWFYYVNNKGPGYGMSFYEVEDQDVIRIQFTLCMGDLAQISNIDKGTRSLALIKEYLEGNSSDKQIMSIQQKAYEILSDIDADKEVVTELQETLQGISQDIADGTKDQDYAVDQMRVDVLYDMTKAHDVECRIDMLPLEITLDHQKWIEEVNGLYKGLTSAQASWMDSEIKDKLDAVVADLEILIKEKEEAEKKAKDQTAAKSVTTQINAIGTVTLAKESVILAARKAYNALSLDAKKLVDASVLSKLVDAEKKLDTLKKEAEKKKYTPAKVKITKITSKKKQAKLTWKKIASASGYEIEMSKKKASGFKKIATIKKAKTVNYTKKKLKSKKTMYFRVRAYRKVGKTTYYGAYSAAKKIKIK